MIRKNFLWLIAILPVSWPVHTMEYVTIQLPSAEKINEYLHQASLDHFTAHTRIDQHLGNQELNQFSFVVAVETHVHNYIRFLKLPMKERVMQMHKQRLIECILQDSPIILEILIKTLKEIGIFKQNELAISRNLSQRS